MERSEIERLRAAVFQKNRRIEIEKFRHAVMAARAFGVEPGMVVHAANTLTAEAIRIGAIRPTKAARGEDTANGRAYVTEFVDGSEMHVRRTEGNEAEAVPLYEHEFFE